MRLRNLLGVTLVLSIALVFAIRRTLPFLGIDLGFMTSVGSHLLASFVIFPILLIVLTPLNDRVRQWRKDNGRDIAEEERYETDHGMIRLTPNDAPKDGDAE